jgi:hypothetical protein
MTQSIDRSVLWRSALVQVLAVGVLSIILALALPHSFFDDWGWLTGPVAWLLCAALTARLLGLPAGRTLAGATFAGIISVPAVLLGLHWLGVVLAIGIFAAWCARLATLTRVTAWTSG